MYEYITRRFLASCSKDAQGLETTVELWFAGGAVLDALHWFANDQGCGGWRGRSNYPALKVLGFRNASMHLDEMGEREGQVEGVVSQHMAKDFCLQFRKCELPESTARDLKEAFGDRLQVRT